MGGKSKNEEDGYWGYLIQPDKSPSPLLQELLLGIAHYISKHVTPWDTRTLTPSKLAKYYRLVGGNYDGLFLKSAPASLSFIYKSMGCFHSLQPSKDPFASPSIPALTNDGFVRWQTVQLLLDPEEHVRFLQETLKRFEIKNPMTGEFFPGSLPTEAFPRKPDADMTRWHDEVGEKLFRAYSRGVPSAELVGTATPEERPGYEAEVYMPSSSGSGRRQSYVGHAGGATPAASPATPAGSRSQSRVRSSSGLQAPHQYSRRHSVPDGARGQPDAPPQRVYTPPLQTHHRRTASRQQSYEASGSFAQTEDSYFTRPAWRRQTSSPHVRTGSSTSPHARQSQATRPHSRDGPTSHSRSPLQMPPPPRPQPYQQRRPTLPAEDLAKRRHTFYMPSSTTDPVHRSNPSTQDSTPGYVYVAATPPSQSGMQHGTFSGGRPGPVPPNNVPQASMQSSSPPQTAIPASAPQMQPPAPSQIQHTAIPLHLRSHPAKQAGPVPAQFAMQSKRSMSSAFPAGASQPPSSSSDLQPSTLPGLLGPGTFSPSQASSYAPAHAPGVRFAPDTTTIAPSNAETARSGSISSASGANEAAFQAPAVASPTVAQSGQAVNDATRGNGNGDRPRRRTMDEVSQERERERMREELQFEWSRRRQRDRVADRVPSGSSLRRPRSGGLNAN